MTAVSDPQRRDGMRIAVIWLGLSVVCMPLVYFVWGPHLPPGGLSDQAAGQRFDNRVLGTVATPVVLLVCIFLVYALVYWRQEGDEIVDGPPIHGNARVSGLWVGITTVTVLALAVFGTYELEDEQRRRHRVGAIADLRCLGDHARSR